jgi:two-component sensor histidine kinase
MEVGDNGIGYNDDSNNKQISSLGLKLINNLSRQIKGSIKKDNSKKGTNYIISFQEIKQYK